jgi:hypothetical protein
MEDTLMSWIFKLALVSATIYVTIFLLFDIALLLASKAGIVWGVEMTRPMWVGLFVTVWAASFGGACLLSPLTRR